MRTNRKKNLKIIAACSVAIFSLAALIGGSFAWFAMTMDFSQEIEEFAVVNSGSGNCGLRSVELIKFDYKVNTYGTGANQFTSVEYLTPETGSVNKYDYDAESDTFGYYSDPLDDTTWVPVPNMNIFDPIDLTYFQDSLKDMNCNAVYKFIVESSELTDVNLNATVNKMLEKTKLTNEIFLADCTNFDIYFESDLLDSNPAFTDGDDHKMYYPSYIDKSEDLDSAEEYIYYKISYLASLEASHTNFYGSGEDSASLINQKALSFDHNLITFYVNVNYEPDELMSLQNRIYQENIKAVYNFSFSFDFQPRESE